MILVRDSNDNGFCSWKDGSDASKNKVRYYVNLQYVCTP